ncbi:MAG: class I SAM-dependent methyltransferase [Candidatus Saganbacteria bacterium]|nr:class I SAM-dependent methyltransferase [Candidatus Saganbacteria bacterium]
MHPYEEDQNKFFGDLYKKHGYSHKSLCWETPFTQQARFIELLKICAMVNTSGTITILDFGCGLGHLYKFIKDQKLIENWKLDYTGVDINKDFIEAAKREMPMVKFRIKNDSVYSEKYDFVLASGLYNLKFSEDFDIHKYYTEELIKLFAIAQRGVAVNFQSNGAIPLIPKHLLEQEKKKFYFHDKQEVLNNLKKVTENIKFVDGYLPHDFTVYLLK